MADQLQYQSIKNTSVVTSVKDWLTDQMIQGNLRPGDKLPTEAELCANLGASRNSVREAIKQLEAYGVVYIKRAEGTFVSDSFNVKMLSPMLYNLILQNSRWGDFVEFRRCIDIGCLYVIIEKKLTAEELTPAREALDKLEAAVECKERSVKEINEADCAFHNALVTLTGNPQLMTLSEYVNQITVPSREATTRRALENGDIEKFAELHRQIYTIIEEGKKEAIEETVRQHYFLWEKN